jgi:uncharacterized protein
MGNFKMPPYLIEKPEGILIKIYVQPRSAKNAIVGPHADSLKVKLTAPPVEGAANKMCAEYFSKLLKLPKSSVEVVSGHAGRSKGLMILVPDEKPNFRERRRIVQCLSSYCKDFP